MGKYFMYIAGKWVESESSETLKAYNPANGEVIGEFPRGTRKDAQDAMKSARASRGKISSMSIWERAELCHRIGDVMENRKEELAKLISMEQGKPYHTEAVAEVETAITGFHNAGELIKWLETSFIPVEDKNKRVFTTRQPRGVYAVVTPWNFPINIPAEYLAPGLASGNAIVWVPAPSTTLCAIKLMECLVEAGVPEGVVNLVTGEGPVVGDEIVSNDYTDAVGFTGSSRTGKLIARNAAGKPQLLEQGGNGPSIVFEDADLETAAEAIADSSFFCSGQACSSTERLLVQESVVDRLAELLVEKAQAIRVGNPSDENVNMGPLNNQATIEKVQRHVNDAVEKGAELLIGGNTLNELGSSLFYEPTVLKNVPLDSEIAKEETFGPIVPIIAFKTEQEALEIADNDSLGLVSSVWTNRMSRAFRIAEFLRTGIVNINEQILMNTLTTGRYMCHSEVLLENRVV